MRRGLALIISISILVFSFSTVLGALMNRPVFVSYITSNSMEPTLSKGDLIFMTPVFFSLEKGDIIVFYSNGEWVCHRIFSEISGGYITKGDNNIATDQQSGKDLVKREFIAGKVITFLDRPVKIPQVGNYVSEVSEFAWNHKTLMVAVFFLAGLAEIMLGGDKKRRKKRRSRKSLRLHSDQVFLILTFSLLLLTTFSGTIWIGNEKIQYGVTSAGGLREEWVLPGQVFQRNLTVSNNLHYPMIYAVKGGGNSAIDEYFVLWPGESKTLTVTIKAPIETRLYEEKILVAKYFPLLPPEIAYRLFSINEYIPVLMIDLEILAVLTIIHMFSGEKKYYRIRMQPGLFKRKMRNFQLK
ncbi:signal peptidase I [Geoglobus acetivorans]|uniref:Signal peptidase I n=1 Tax=Geoglobus acetivorans TaxID=565033 RepID=A0ABZ3H599_GEOAI|nr:signal peptidase I [Geoglobus acetivorans]